MTRGRSGGRKCPKLVYAISVQLWGPKDTDGVPMIETESIIRAVISFKSWQLTCVEGVSRHVDDSYRVTFVCAFRTESPMSRRYFSEPCPRLSSRHIDPTLVSDPTAQRSHLFDLAPWTVISCPSQANMHPVAPVSVEWDVPL